MGKRLRKPISKCRVRKIRKEICSTIPRCKGVFINKNRSEHVSAQVPDIADGVSESTKASTTEVQTIKSRKRKKTNAQRCREYRERKKLQNTMVLNITAERSDECSATDQLPAKKPKTDAERRKKYYEAQKLKKQKIKKIPKTDKQRNKEYYYRKKKIQALNNLNHHSDVSTIPRCKGVFINKNTSEQETFVMRLTKCVCCLERDAEELLWAERPHVGSYGDLIKELFGVQFPVPDNVATKTRICDQCKAELERTLQFRTSMLAAQSRLKLAFWPTPSPDTEDMDMVQSIKVEITEYEDNETAPEDINIEVTCKTEVDIEEHDVGAFSEATSSLVPRPAAKDAHTVQGTRKTTAKRREVSSKPSAGSSRTTQPADNSNARINYSELDETEVKVEPINVKLEPDPLAGDSVPLLFEHELSLGPWP